MIKTPNDTLSTQFRYHHLGIPTTEDFAGATYLPHLKVHVSDHLATPYGIQWMRYGDECTLPTIVKEIPHVAFEVDDLIEALEGKEVIIEPNSPSTGVTVAFILENGAPVELLELSKE